MPWIIISFNGHNLQTRGCVTFRRETHLAVDEVTERFTPELELLDLAVGVAIEYVGGVFIGLRQPYDAADELYSLGHRCVRITPLLYGFKWRRRRHLSWWPWVRGFCT